MRRLNDQSSGKKIAYILKNFPKLSETFIASEIYRLENLGVDLKLFVIKPPTEDLKHAVVEKIRAPKFYLPATASLSDASLFGWLKMHFKDFKNGLSECLKQRPQETLKAARFAFAQAVRARREFFSLPRKIYLKEFLQACSIAAEILKDKEIRHIHAHFAHGATTVAWMISIITNLKFSFTAHAKDIYLESLNPAGLLARKMNAARFVVTCTKANQRHLETLSDTPVHCLYHGLGAEFSGMLSEQKIKKIPRNGHLRALAVGRLVSKKGLDVFVEACKILRDRQINFKAEIVGESGDAEPKIKALIEKHNLKKTITLTGAMTQRNLFRQYHNTDVFCLPCRVLENGDRDGIPNVMVEAMACGVPVVSTDVSGIPEIIKNGENGILVETENASAIADSLEKIYADKLYADRLAAQGLQTVRENFDGDVTAQKLKDLFEEQLCS